MKRQLTLCGLLFGSLLAMARGNVALDALTERVCGRGTAKKIEFRVTDDGAPEHFTITRQGNRPCIEANTLSAASMGLGWYLNHYVRANITWNHLTENLSRRRWPAPEQPKTHSTALPYRYYLNYCTFSYSMSAWDETRWMQEIDWMALHGVNLPLQIVGIDALWYQMLRQDLGYSHEEANRFVAGPMFQGWWLMNNLTGHGGPNPEWWYEREAQLGRAITDRMRELGMTPCLPGFVGMAPERYAQDSRCKAYDGKWCGFPSPLLIDVSDDAGRAAFFHLARLYYQRMQQVFGFTPQAYSMDPVHERSLPQGMGQAGFRSLCQAAREALDRYGQDGALWVAQMWQVNADQHRIDALEAEHSLLLDLSSERLTYVDRYGQRPYVFCMLHNYGGNIGMYGCIQQMLSNFRDHQSRRNLQGVGATPEGIETNPVLYELLFELPWHAQVPEAEAWLDEYTRCRYGVDDVNAQQAWRKLLATVYHQNRTWQQGCREPVFCARPNLEGRDASSWASAPYDWDKQEVIDAARLLLAAKASNANYRYDVVDVVRQALTDHAHTLQMQLRDLREAGKKDEFAEKKDAFLALIADIDALLGTTEDFRMGHWAGRARDIAQRAGHPEDADWLERNARMLVTTWGETPEAVDRGGLRDYGNREYQGLLTDFYLPRWQRYFEADCTDQPWLTLTELPYVDGKATPYGAYPARAAKGDALKVAARLMRKYFDEK